MNKVAYISKTSVTQLRNCFAQMNGEMGHMKCLVLMSVLVLYFNIPYKFVYTNCWSL